MSARTFSGRTLGLGCALLWSAATVTLSAVGCGSDPKGEQASGGNNASAGAPGQASHGGAASGGSSNASNGGEPNAGAPAGGTGSGGRASGGTANGGVASAGAASGGAPQGGKSGASRGGSANGGAAAASGGSPSGGTASGGASSTGSACDAPNLVWKSANKTNYTSYPEPGSEECVKFNGCTWAGQFAACNDKKPEQWVSTHNIVAAFPDFDALELHDLCLRKGTKTIVVTVLDTCGDSDCDGCCTQNLGKADQLIDIESYTNTRWGVPDGPIEWADLGPTKGSGCN